MERVLILGASGLVGKALIKELSAVYEVHGTYHTNPIEELGSKSVHLDVTNVNHMKMLLDEVKPSMVISCLRGDYDAQLKVHQEVANYLKRNQGVLYYCSTANVFDKLTDGSHIETDELGAGSEYGQFKIKCEKILGELLDQQLCILRLPMIWGKDSPRLNTLNTNLEYGDDIVVYKNLFITSNTDAFLAKQVHYLMNHKKSGIYHLASKDVINHKDFIRQLVKELGYENVTYNEETLPGEKYYLAIIPGDNRLPEDLHITNDQIISFLTD